MFTRTALGNDDLLSLLDGIMAYNQRGQAVSLIYYDADGKQLPAVGIEVLCEDKGLKVRIEPEPEIELDAAKYTDMAIADPHKVPGPLTMAQLAAMRDKT